MEKNRDKMFDTPDFEKKTLGKRRERRKKHVGRKRWVEGGRGLWRLAREEAGGGRNRGTP